MADFITKKENTRRMAVIIVCVILDAVALTIGIYGVKKTKDLEEKPENPENIKELRKVVAEKRKVVGALNDSLVAFAPPFGWRTHAVGTAERFVAGPLNHESMKKFLSDWAVKLRDYGVVKYKRWEDPGAGENLTIKVLFEELLAKEKEYQARINDLNGQIEAERTREKNTIQATNVEADALKKDLEGDVKPDQPAQGAIGELIKLMKDLNKLQADHVTELNQAEIDTISEMNKATAVKNENVRKRAAAEGVKGTLRHRIYTIQHKREEAKERREPDGEILGVDLKRQTVHINLLRKDRLFKGTKFHVYSLEKGGVKVDKGQVEAIEVRDEGASVAAILQTYDAEWVMKPGDKIYNEFYEGGRARYIAFAGQFRGKLSNEEGAALIREFGDHYQPRVDERTNYVVVSDGYEEHPNYKAALELGVKILLEKYLYDYLGVPR